MQSTIDYHLPKIHIYKQLHKFLQSNFLLEDLLKPKENKNNSIDQSRTTEHNHHLRNKEDTEERVLSLICHPPDIDLIGMTSSPTNLVKLINEQQQLQKPFTRVIIAVGPEGGWLPQEVKAFYEKGFHVYGLGDRVLRTDMAVTILLQQAHDILSAARHL